MGRKGVERHEPTSISVLEAFVISMHVNISLKEHIGISSFIISEGMMMK